MKNYEALSVYDKLQQKIYAYYQTIWKEKWKEGIDETWLSNFKHIDREELFSEKINMLYLLSKFMYFGHEELRQLLHSLFRDLFKYPIVATIRKSRSNTLDLSIIESEFLKELEATRFLGVGNPSESGVHMLYYFRQECKLSKKYFINSSDIFSMERVTDAGLDHSPRTYIKSELTDKNIKRYIFIDDFCGSGSQATMYLKNIVENIKFEDRDIEVNYFMLFGTEVGIANVRKLGVFDKVESVFTLDESFKTFSDPSRYYSVSLDEPIDKEFANKTALKYGTTLFDPPLGYGNCQLLLALFHNTPDNTLPIFWCEENHWKPIFIRHNKIY